MTVVAVLVLALVTTGWFALALLPALAELVRRTDVEPLQLRRGGGDIRHFANGFHRFVEMELAALRDVPPGADSGSAERLRDGEPAWHVPPGDTPVTLPLRMMPHGALSTHVVLSESPLVVPDGSQLLKELYVARGLRGGPDCYYRAALVGGDASLGARSGVLRWIDAGGVLEAGESSVLYGRASSAKEMRLFDGVRFQRVAAPCIVFGTGALIPARAERGPVPVSPAMVDDERAPVGEGEEQPITKARPSVAMGTRAPLQPPPGVTESWGRWLIEGDFDVPAGEFVPMDLVVTGRLTIGAGTRVTGAVKAAVLEGGQGVIYNGAIVATSRLVLGAGSEAAGPLVVEGEAWIGAASLVGSEQEPTTISAVRVRAGRGAVVYGEVWAREYGEVERG